MCSFESQSFMNAQMDFIFLLEKDLFMLLLYVYMFPISEIKWENSLQKDRLDFLFCFSFSVVIQSDYAFEH